MAISRKKGGFTLIELLVVIAIIAILAAILFPVFAKAREAARKATCQANMKEIGISWRMYVDENFDTMPPVGGANAWTPYTPGGVGGVGNLLYPYKKNKGIDVCPSDTKNSGLSYFVKAQVGAGGWKETDFNWPADQILMFERGSFHWGGDEMFAAGDGATFIAKTSSPDPYTINCSFMDGHVKTVRIPATGGIEPNSYNTNGNTGVVCPAATDPRFYCDTLN